MPGTTRTIAPITGPPGIAFATVGTYSQTGTTCDPDHDDNASIFSPATRFLDFTGNIPIPSTPRLKTTSAEQSGANHVHFSSTPPASGTSHTQVANSRHYHLEYGWPGVGRRFTSTSSRGAPDGLTCGSSLPTRAILRSEFEDAAAQRVRFDSC
jgi:hypothetical protein